MKRFSNLWCVVMVGLSLAIPLAHAADPALPEVVIHKDPDCGCCGKWAEHLQASGFRVKTVAEADMQRVKQKFGVPERLGSCHTAKVGGYLIEGHVPASEIKRLLQEKPAVKGLAVPGMPAGSPGMESPHPQSYDVLSFDEKGRTGVFARH